MSCGPRSSSAEGSSGASQAGAGIHVSVLEPGCPGLLRRSLLGCVRGFGLGAVCSCVTLCSVLGLSIAGSCCVSSVSLVCMKLQLSWYMHVPFRWKNLHIFPRPRAVTPLCCNGLGGRSCGRLISQYPCVISPWRSLNALAMIFTTFILSAVSTPMIARWYCCSLFW